MHPFCKPVLLAILLMPVLAAAQEAAVAPSSSGGLFKVFFGLLLVLAVIAAVAWLMKQLTAVKGGSQSVARVVGGVSVGTRERVVVVEVADRWIVVGVAPGQVSSIANLEIGASQQALQAAQATQASPLAETPFAKWLKKALEK